MRGTVLLFVSLLPLISRFSLAPMTIDETWVVYDDTAWVIVVLLFGSPQSDLSSNTPLFAEQFHSVPRATLTQLANKRKRSTPGMRKHKPTDEQSSQNQTMFNGSVLSLFFYSPILIDPNKTILKSRVRSPRWKARNEFDWLRRFLTRLWCKGVLRYHLDACVCK